MSDSDEKMPEKLGRYEIVGPLGKGAMGVVYEGRDPNIGRRVAIKTARRDVMEASGRADEMMERFLREARAAGGINHPNIITIYDADEQDGLAYMAMEFIEGTDLHKLNQSRRKFSVEQIIEMGAIISEALGHAHAKGVVHRDVKPSNILVLDDGTLRVADFGIAHVTDSNLTQEGAMIGTPHYMSPEQFMGQKVDGRSDLFSVGIILYELLTGEKPFPGEAISTVMHSVIKTNPIDPKELNLSVNPVLSQVVMKALAKDPGQRYQSGAEMAAALRECLKENPDPAVTKTARLAASLEATVATAGDATVVAHDPNATRLSEPPKDLLAADTHSGAERAKDSAGVEKQSSTPSGDRGTRDMRPIMAAAAGVVVVLGAIAVLMVRGGEAGQATGGTADTRPFILTVHLADTAEVAERAMPGSIDQRPNTTGCKEPSGFTVVIKENESASAVLKSITINSDQGTVDVPLSYDSLWIEVSALDAGYRTFKASLNPHEPLPPGLRDIVLVHEDAFS